MDLCYNATSLIDDSDKYNSIHLVHNNYHSLIMARNVHDGPKIIEKVHSW